MKDWGSGIAILCGVLLAGCGDDGRPNKPGPSDVAGAGGEASVGSDAAGGAEDSPASSAAGASAVANEVSADLDADGGAITLSGVTVTVPAGALTEATTLTLMRVGSTVPGYELYSDVFELTANGALFTKPVEVLLDYRGERQLANLFVTSAALPAYSWASTTVTEAAASAQLAAGSRFFVGNGAEYEVTPEMACTRVDVVDGVFSSGRSINLLARVTDCEGRALMTLKGADFVALEDGEPLAQRTVELREPAPLAPFVTLLLDVATLAVAPDETAEAMRSALRSLAGSGQRVGLSLYGDGDTLTELAAPMLDLSPVQAAVDGLASYHLPGKVSHSAYAAVASAVANDTTRLDAFRGRNAGGALGEGFVIWVSASTSSEHKATQHAALATIADAGDRVVAVSLNGPIDPIGNDELFAVPDPSGLHRALLAAVQRVKALVGSTYWLSYCGSKSSGIHAVGARVAGDVFELGRTGEFDATGSLPSCEPATPLTDCSGKQCGGGGCGGCDDTTSQCDGNTGQCVSFCKTEHWCGGQTHPNPNGYAQKCDDTPTATACAEACVNLETNSSHCGSCDTACPAGSSCSGGTCVCSGGSELCDGACVDTSLNSRHCGKCGTACASGEGCFGGKCANACPSGLHGPTLVKVPTPAGGIMCIDSTEVTVGQYADFVKDRAGDASGQIPECAWNLYFAPPEGCGFDASLLSEPLKHPQECVDWCDAAAFCKWAGKRLCGGIDEPHVAIADLADAKKDAWYNACSSGGVNNYPFGNTCNTMPCRLEGYTSSQVPAGYQCQASGAYQGVFDLIGNVEEWVDSCTPYPNSGGTLDGCQIRGGGYSGGGSPASCSFWDQSTARCGAPDPNDRRRRDSAQLRVGFRCCGR